MLVLPPIPNSSSYIRGHLERRSSRHMSSSPPKRFRSDLSTLTECWPLHGTHSTVHGRMARTLPRHRWASWKTVLILAADMSRVPKFIKFLDVHQLWSVGWVPKPQFPWGLWEDPPFTTMTIQCSAYSHVAGAKSLRHGTSRRTFDAGNSTGSKAISSAWCMGWLELPQRCSACQWIWGFYLIFCHKLDGAMLILTKTCGLGIEWF